MGIWNHIDIICIVAETPLPHIVHLLGAFSW